MSATMRVAFLLFDTMDLMDFAGPFEVFLTANRLRERAGQAAPFEVTTVSPGGRDITAYGGLRVGVDADVSQMAASDVPSPDVVVVPGTIDIESATADVVLGEAVATLAAHAEVTASVCTGAFLLAQADVLAGHRWTTHWEDLAELSHRQPGAQAARVVDSGAVVTAGGIACGLDLGLHLVARLLADEPFARSVARQMDYDWRSPNGT